MSDIERLQKMLPEMARFESQLNALRAVLEELYSDEYKDGDYLIEVATRLLLKRTPEGDGDE